MTNEEAKEQLKQIPIHDGVSDNYLKIIYEAIDMAIEALEQQPCEDVVSRECNNCAYYVNGANDEACDGCFEDEEHLNFKAKNDNKIIHCKDCKYRDYWGDCTKWSKELDAHKSYILDENMFCGFAERKASKGGRK